MAARRFEQQSREFRANLHRIRSHDRDTFLLILDIVDEIRQDPTCGQDCGGNLFIRREQNVSVLYQFIPAKNRLFFDDVNAVFEKW